ncbi:hypothetical protein [Pseudobythopirellula maris]|uniref:hypothetical protein n=1 Tax=Pseudobythopirellula maris TaxID=2527991 RepID=UPI0011B69BD8|nr:hypothetical protein [Pseudobythopirellula maris]
MAHAPVGGYHTGGEAASEPTAWSALALARAGQDLRARLAGDWLAARQAADGSVGVMADQPEPRWPTALAILAWCEIDRHSPEPRYQDATRRAVEWALADRGWTGEPNENVGHDMTLTGWSWAADTHSWLEPTAYFVLALKAAGLAGHDRTREAVALLIDRLLPAGGCNYGNTIVLGQELLRHAQPTGIAAWALADEQVEDPRFERTLEALSALATEPMGVMSLSFVALGLTANGLDTRAVRDALSKAQSRVQNAGLQKLALHALAWQATDPAAPPLATVGAGSQ